MLLVLALVRLAALAPSSMGDQIGPEILFQTTPPAVQLSILSANPRVSLTWQDLGPDFGWVVETRDSLTATARWAPAAASVWPIPRAAWIDPALARGGAQFFRVTRTPSKATRGKILSTTELPSLSRAEIQAVFSEIGLSLPAEIGVRLHRIVYETINPFELRTEASGLLVLPEITGKALPLASYQHGTILARDEAPSSMQGLERVIGLAFGTSGYAAVLPDYAGLGESPGLHPFVHAKSEAAATIDLLRAARVFCASNSVALNGQLFLLGYSEGGHATMATHKEIETFHAGEFVITASAPMAGPYDLSGVMAEDFLSDREMPNPYYFVYLLAAYQSIYQFADSLSEILAPPYDRTVPPLLDGRHSGSEINRAMGGSVPTRILRPEFLEAFKNDPNHPLRLALRENDLYDWTPVAPMKLYHCGGDRDVLYANSKVAYDRFVQRGATHVELINPLPLADHGQCAPIALLAAKFVWFDSLVEE